MIPRAATWQNPRILSTLLFVFVAGAAAGALTMRMGLHQKMHRAMPSWKEGNKEIFLNKFKKELNLSGAQVEQVAQVLEDYRNYYQSLQDQIEDVRATGKNRILEILTPEQRVRFEKMLAELGPGP